MGGLGGTGFTSGAVFHDNFIQLPCNGNQGHDNIGSPQAFNDIYFFNNLVTQSFHAAVAAASRGIDIFPQDGGGSTFLRLVVANNDFNVPALFTIRLGDPSGDNPVAAWTDCIIENDANINCNDAGNGSWAPLAQTEVPIVNCFAPATSDFVNYSAWNMNLVSGATDLIQQGLNLYSTYASALGAPFRRTRAEARDHQQALERPRV